jgi:hypothetical protein
MSVESTSSFDRNAGGGQRIPDASGRLYTEKADTLLSKYTAVWLWSVILGSNSGLLWSGYGLRFGFGSEQLVHYGTVIMAFSLVSLAFSVRSLFALRSMLFHYILPEFFGTGNDRSSPSSLTVSPRDATGRAMRDAPRSRSDIFTRDTRNAVNAVLYSSICKIIGDVSFMALVAMSRNSL